MQLADINGVLDTHGLLPPPRLLLCRRPTLADINRELYCGWANADCGSREAGFFGPSSDGRDVSDSSSSDDQEMSVQASLGSSSRERGQGSSGSSSRRVLRGLGDLPPAVDWGMPAAAGHQAEAAQRKEEGRFLAKVGQHSCTLSCACECTCADVDAHPHTHVC